MLKKLSFYWFCINWLWKNRTWCDTRQKYKALNRAYNNYVKNKKAKRNSGRAGMGK